VSVKPSRYKAGNPAAPNQVPGSQGILKEAIEHTLVAQFNDLESVERIMKVHGNDVAAIILEPVPMNMGLVLPRQGFLEGLRDICDEYNCLLIFDEIKTGGKLYSGAAGYFKVKPDIMILGKSIAGGFPLSVVAGRREIMQSVVPGVIAHAGTFNANPVAVRAGLVTLKYILTEEALAQAAELNKELTDGFRDIASDHGVDVVVKSLGISGSLMFSENDVTDWRSFLNVDVGKWLLFFTAMMNRGIIMNFGPNEQWTVSVQHKKEEVERALEVFKEIAPMVKEMNLKIPVKELV